MRWPWAKKKGDPGGDTWVITVKGHGPRHREGAPTDADRMAARFVTELLKAGHSVEYAELQVVGDATDITHAAGYESGRASTDPKQPPEQ